MGKGGYEPSSVKDFAFKTTTSLTVTNTLETQETLVENLEVTR